MAAEECEGIILARHRFSESSWTLRAFTRERGRLDLLAKGARRPKSPMFGHLDLYNREALLVYERRGDLDLLADSYVFDEHLRLRSRPAAFAGAGMLAEAARFGFAARDPHPEVYAALAWALSAFCGPSKIRTKEAEPDEAKTRHAVLPVPAVGATALWALLGGMGYTPRLSVCAGCGRSAPNGRDGGALSSARGGWVCRACVRRGDAPLSPRDALALRRLAERAHRTADESPAAAALNLWAGAASDAGPGLAAALAEYLGRCVGRGMASVRVWRALNVRR